MKNLILLATSKELKLVAKLNLKNNYDVRIIGVGAYNVLKTLSNIDLTKYRNIYNIGYAGGQNIGELLKINRIVNRGHFQNEDLELEVFNLKSNYTAKFFGSYGYSYDERCKDSYEMFHEYTYSNFKKNRKQYYQIEEPIVCETGDFFHTDTIQKNKVYDMELWYIAKYLYENQCLDKLVAYKVVSDNGDMKEYEKNSK